MEKEKYSFWDFLKFTIIAVLIVIPVRIWIAQPFIVSGASMHPTFEHGDYLIVDELSYQFRKPQKGDVIIFRYPIDPSKFFIKRITGVPGETIENDKGKTTLDDEEYFVEGDNKSASSDSRIWGPVPEDLVVGRALVRLWPPEEIEILPGQKE